MQKKRLEGLHGGRRVLDLLEHPGRLLSTILVGNTIVNVLVSSIGTLLLESVLPGSLGMAVGAFLLTLVLLVFGEVTPKVLASAHAVEISRRISYAVGLIVWLLAPVSRLLSTISSAAVRLSGGGSRHRHRILTESEVISLLELGRDEGVLGSEALVTVALMTLRESRCSEAMVPRADVATLRTVWTRQKMLEIVSGTEFTRYPLLEGPTDNVAGFVNASDLLVGDSETLPVKRMAFFPENAPLDAVLEELRRSTDPIGAVFDEYGDWTGIVTVDDILDYTVFHSMTGTRDLPEGVHRRGRGFVVPGGLRLEKLVLLLGEVPDVRYAETCSGLLQEVSGRIPGTGESVETGGLRFTVLESAGPRINSILVELVSREAGG